MTASTDSETAETVTDELWSHVIVARCCVEANPSPEAIAALRAHLASFEAHFLKTKAVH